jgi:hypothetical protein
VTNQQTQPFSKDQAQAREPTQREVSTINNLEKLIKTVMKPIVSDGMERTRVEQSNFIDLVSLYYASIPLIECFRQNSHINLFSCTNSFSLDLFLMMRMIALTGLTKMRMGKLLCSLVFLFSRRIFPQANPSGISIGGAL